MKVQELKNMIEVLSKTQSFLNEIHEDLKTQEDSNEPDDVMILQTKSDIDMMASAVKQARLSTNLWLQKDLPEQKKEAIFRSHDALASTQIFLEDVSSSAGKTLDLWVNSDQLFEMSFAVQNFKKFCQKCLEQEQRKESKHGGMER